MIQVGAMRALLTTRLSHKYAMIFLLRNCFCFYMESICTLHMHN